MKHLNKEMFDRLNHDIDFEDLAVGMKVTLDGTVDAGLYEVVRVYNNLVAVEQIEAVNFREVRDVLENIEYDLNDLVSNIRYHIGDIETLGMEVLKYDELLSLIDDFIEVNLAALKDILKADYYKSIGLTNKGDK